MFMETTPDNSRSERASLSSLYTWLPDLDVMCIISRRNLNNINERELHSFPLRAIYSQQHLTYRFTSTAHVFTVRQCCHSVTAPKRFRLLPRGLALRLIQDSSTSPTRTTGPSAPVYLCSIGLFFYLAEDILAPTEGPSTHSSNLAKLKLVKY
jgi:hypothetical protein